MMINEALDAELAKNKKRRKQGCRLTSKQKVPSKKEGACPGLMTEKELEDFDSIVTTYPKYWVPMNWVFRLIRLAREEKNIPGEMIYVDLMEIDLYVPIMSILQFIFFVGWMKVAEVLLNPLGEDDDDFECNYILDRNLQSLNTFFKVGLNVVDKAYDTFPEMVRDNYWEDSLPEPLYTAESAQRPINPQVGSCVDMSTHEEPFMIHPRRRTISRASHWDGEVENEDLVPVIGNDKAKENSSCNGDSNSLSPSYAGPTRRISGMFKRLQGGHRFSVTNSFRPPWKTQAVSDVNIERQNKLDAKSTHSSSSSLDRFDESFHNKVNPPGLYPQNGTGKFSRSVPDGMKMMFDEAGPKSPRSPAPGGVAWFVDELAVIEEEGPEKRRISEEGLMTAREFEEYEKVNTNNAKYWLPIQWLLSLITLAYEEKRIKGEVIYVSLLDRIAVFRSTLINLWLFDWVPVPLVYTQVVHLTVYSYFVIALFARQYIDRDPLRKSIDLYVPIMTVLQFTFFIGWLKVAEVLLNPLGEDDDDFECNWIIDRNLQVGFSVEECYDMYPPIDRDSFWSYLYENLRLWCGRGVQLALLTHRYGMEMQNQTTSSQYWGAIRGALAFRRRTPSSDVRAVEDNTDNVSKYGAAKRKVRMFLTIGCSILLKVHRLS
ncbi:Bestrophin [Teladorsagia circumcincta]|uniref:Bestrophin homolog n=1 Tax=Teladorsagia circumcincta TaxID=45464 RepID=A0A2G9UT50_TELCI|nr:Bestrophin [Teladorsagia circumcincta]